LKATWDSNGEMRTPDDVPQQSLEDIQQELEFPSMAIFPYCSLIFSFKCIYLSTDTSLLEKVFKLVREVR
jgi:hypothetical protein